MFDWNDVRTFLAVARGGSQAGAASKLGIDSTTVGRRMARLESALKATLIVRCAAGTQLTAAGAELLAAALDVEKAMERVTRVGRPDVIAGTVRICAAEGFGTAIIAPSLAALSSQRPGLRVELAAASSFLSPSRREVDMAITLSAPTSYGLVVEPLTHFQLALYAAPSYLADRGAPICVEDLFSHTLVGYVGDLIYASELRYLEEIHEALVPTLASSSIRAQQEIIATGGGLGVLPCFLAHGLTRVLPDEVLLERRFWLSTYSEVHATARMRLMRNWLQQLVAAKQQVLAPYGSLRG